VEARPEDVSSAPLPSRQPPTPTEAADRVRALFEQYGRMVYGVCRAMLRDVLEAEDAAQQVFLSAHRALLGGAQVRDPGRWLAAIARNECRQRIGAGMRRPLAIADEDFDALPALVDDEARRAELAELQDAIAALPDRQRQAVVLRYLYGLRYGEVATALGISRPATEALLFRARRSLHGRLRTGAGAALAVPVALRDELAQAIPGFAAGGASGTAAVAGGLLAKLVGSSAGMKVATAAVAVSAAGTVGAVETQRSAVDHREREAVVGVAPSAPAGAELDRSGHGGSGADARRKERDRGELSEGDDPEPTAHANRSGPDDGRPTAEAPKQEADSSDPGPGGAEDHHGGRTESQAQSGSEHRESGKSSGSGSGEQSGSEPEDSSGSGSGKSGSSEHEESSGSGSGKSDDSGPRESSGSGSGGSDGGSDDSRRGSGDGDGDEPHD